MKRLSLTVLLVLENRRRTSRETQRETDHTVLHDEAAENGAAAGI
jgi:hypothetical protein